MKTYRNRPVVVEAEIFHVGVLNAQPILHWIKSNGGTAVWCGAMPPHHRADGRVKHPGLPESLRIRTPSGWEQAFDGDYIVHESQGRFIPLSPEDFHIMYVEDLSERLAEVVKLPVRSEANRSIS
jgi:hypothetical protein